MLRMDNQRICEYLQNDCNKIHSHNVLFLTMNKTDAVGYVYGLQLTPRWTPNDLGTGHELVRKFISGDKSAFDEIYKIYEEFVYHTCLGVMGNPEDARDAMQETFVSIYHGLRKFRYDSKLSTWVYRTAVNRCLDALRSRKGRLRNSSVDFLESPGVMENEIVQEQIVRSTLMKIKAEYRAVLVLFYFQGLSYEDIGEAMGWNLNNVRMTLHRARNAFREKYEDRRCRDEM